jgi:hypothetical protein
VAAVYGADGGADLRANLLRKYLGAAAGTADYARAGVGGEWGNPLDTLARGLDDAWQADKSPARDRFVEDLHGIGQAVMDAFARTRDDLDAEAAHAEPMIDVVAHPDQEWKTTDRGVQGRSGVSGTVRGQ